MGLDVDDYDDCRFDEWAEDAAEEARDYALAQERIQEEMPDLPAVWVRRAASHLLEHAEYKYDDEDGPSLDFPLPVSVALRSVTRELADSTARRTKPRSTARPARPARRSSRRRSAHRRRKARSPGRSADEPSELARHYHGSRGLVHGWSAR